MDEAAAAGALKGTPRKKGNTERQLINIALGIGSKWQRTGFMSPALLVRLIDRLVQRRPAQVAVVGIHYHHVQLVREREREGADGRF